MCTVVQIWNLSAGGQWLKTRKSLEIMGWPTYQMDEAPGSAREPVSKNMVGCKQERHPILISASICTLTHVEHTCALTHTHNSVLCFSFPHTYVVSHCHVASVVSDEKSAVDLTKLAHRMDFFSCHLKLLPLPYQCYESAVFGLGFFALNPHWSLLKYLNVYCFLK